jgi:glucuronosyltransferase
MKMRLLLLTAIFFNSFCSCANILGIFPLPWYSHVQFHKSLIAVVLDRGHTVTVITQLSFNFEHENFTEISFNVSWFEDCDQIAVKKKNFKSFYEIVKSVVQLISFHNEQLETLQKILIELNHKHFDLMIHEFYFSSPFMAVAETFNCPVVISSAVASPIIFNSIVGNDVNPVTSADSLNFENAGTHMNFFERFESVTYSMVVLLMIQPFVDIMSYFTIKKYFPSVQATKTELEDRIALIIDRTNPVITSNRPSMNIIQAGFITIEPPKPLPDGELKKFVDESKTGVIYMSFGSIADPSKMTSKEVATFIKTFEKLNYDVVWKFKNASIDNKPNNVFFSEWLPQADLLAHPNVKLFITHAGASVQEAIDREVPMILFPLFGDQYFNAATMERKGVGIALDLNALTEEMLTKAIEEVLKPKYKENIHRLRELVYDEPMSSREKAVWWIEYVIRHKGADNLKSPGRKIPFYQKYCIDIMFFTLTAVYTSLKLFLAIKNAVMRKTVLNVTNKIKTKKM